MVSTPLPLQVLQHPEAPFPQRTIPSLSHHSLVCDLLNKPLITILHSYCTNVQSADYKGALHTGQQYIFHKIKSEFADWPVDKFLLRSYGKCIIVLRVVRFI